MVGWSKLWSWCAAGGSPGRPGGVCHTGAGLHHLPATERGEDRPGRCTPTGPDSGPVEN